MNSARIKRFGVFFFYHNHVPCQSLFTAAFSITRHAQMATSAHETLFDHSNLNFTKRESSWQTASGVQTVEFCVISL